MIFSLFWEVAFIRRGAFILKSDILGGRLFEEIRYYQLFHGFSEMTLRKKRNIFAPFTNS